MAHVTTSTSAGRRRARLARHSVYSMQYLLDTNCVQGMLPGVFGGVRDDWESWWPKEMGQIRMPTVGNQKNRRWGRQGTY